MLQCIVIDDEEFAIEALKKYIDLLPQLSIARVYTDPQMALKELANGEVYDVLFLDIDMPMISGLELARLLRGTVRKLIFTTAHPEFALEAFDVEADAFLLKPVSLSKFSQTISRLFPDADVVQASASDYFLVKNKDEDLRIVKIKFEEVVAFESMHNYIKIYQTNGKPITAYLNLQDVLELVKGRDSFKQFHRGFVISTDWISYIEGNTLKMAGNLTFSVGDRFKAEFNDYLAKRLITTNRKR